MKTSFIPAIIAVIIWPINGWSALPIIGGGTCDNECNTTGGCNCSKSTHKYCCPGQKTLKSCPTGWSLNLACSSCVRDTKTISDSSQHRYETTVYYPCDPSMETRNDCLVSTATDTCGKNIVCKNSGGWLIVNP